MSTKHKTIYLWSLIFVVISTMFCGLIYLSAQQLLRQSANDPQIQYSEDVATYLSKGIKAEDIVSSEKINIEQSLAIFILLVDNDGKTTLGNGYIGDSLPTIPKGVFDNARQTGQGRLTWQPQLNIRQAIIVTPIKDNGFVVVGRSLRETEMRVKQIGTMIEIFWLGSLLIIGLAATLVIKKKI